MQILNVAFDHSEYIHPMADDFVLVVPSREDPVVAESRKVVHNTVLGPRKHPREIPQGWQPALGDPTIDSDCAKWRQWTDNLSTRK